MQGSRTYLALSASSSLRGQRSVISFLDNPTPCRPPTDMTVRHACGVQPELAMYSRLSCERRISDVLIVKMVTRWISDVLCARWIIDVLSVVKVMCTQDQ